MQARPRAPENRLICEPCALVAMPAPPPKPKKLRQRVRRPVADDLMNSNATGTRNEHRSSSGALFPEESGAD